MTAAEVTAATALRYIRNLLSGRHDTLREREAHDRAVLALEDLERLRNEEGGGERGGDP